MTDTTTPLTRLRTRLLAAAYTNADFWTRRTALLTDQALAALARRWPVHRGERFPEPPSQRHWGCAASAGPPARSTTLSFCGPYPPA